MKSTASGGAVVSMWNMQLTTSVKSYRVVKKVIRSNKLIKN